MSVILALSLFVGVLVATALEWTHLCLAALLGAAAMLLLGVLTPLQAAESLRSGAGTIALLFGMMLVVRALEASGAFNGLAHRLVELSGGRGKRLLLGLVLITIPVAALLPNPSAVLLMAQLMPPMARELKLDFRPLLILMVLAANSASLLTLVGDPALYIIGTGMHWDFARYLGELGPAALLVLLTLLATLPWLYRPLWRAQLPVTDLRPAPAHHRGALPWLLLVALLMLLLFITGSSLPVPLDPAAVALGGAVATLFISHHSGLKPVDDLLASIDWATLLYFAAVFVLVGGLERSGALDALAAQLAQRVGQNVLASSLWLLLVSAALSALIPNIPLVAALTPLLLTACQRSGLLQDNGIPLAAAVPLFEALMLGVVIGGSATVIGSSSNLVAAGVARQQGSRLSFRTWLSYGLPTVGLQLLVASLWCWHASQISAA
jgi:Na+/H+ antiporter NhaD/arsenite permease-like protein